MAPAAKQRDSSAESADIARQKGRLEKAARMVQGDMRSTMRWTTGCLARSCG